MKRFAPSFFAFVVAVLSGCATSDPYAALPRSGDPTRDGEFFLQKGPARDRVLWQYRLAAGALRRGNYGEPKSLLDDALLSLGGLAVGDKEARKARGYFREEARKTFLGEPHERVMAYYYRGLLYWKDGEPDNARACFRSAQIQDADAENKAYASDYVLLDYLDGLVTAKLGGDGADAFKRATNFCKIAIPPAYDASANVLFFIDLGTGPTKFAGGDFNQELHFKPGHSAAREAVIRVEQQAVRVGAYDDLTFQATTRGGRVMDHVLANKAVFKSGTDAFGDAAIIGGAVTATAGRREDIGLGLVAAGIISKIVSASTTPAADTRSWDNLPQFLSFAALRLDPGQHTATIEFLDSSTRVIAGLTKTVTFRVSDSRKDTVIFVSDQSSTPQTL